MDKFIIIESRRTFIGKSKPLYYKENYSRFEKWNHKIVSSEFPVNRSSSWDFEIEQRAVLVNLVQGLCPSREDTLSFSDCDEIPNPEVLKTYTVSMGLRNLKQYTFYYNFNHLMDYGNRSWSRARLGSVGDLYGGGGADWFRGGPRDLDPTFPVIENGGWHCSYFGSSLERVRNKVNAISHDDMAPYVQNRTDVELANDIAKGVDLFHRSGIGTAQLLEIKDGDHRFPPYFLKNRERFMSFTNDYFIEVHKEIVKR